MAVFDFAAALPNRLYWDSSFLVNIAFAAAKFHKACTDYYYLLKEERVPVLVSNLTLDETWYILLKLESEQLYKTPTFWDIYRQEPDRLRPILKKLRDFTRRLERLSHITFVGTEAGSYDQALQTMEKHLLLPRDAYHWAIMQDQEISTLATTDTDFTRIPGVTIYTCNGKMLSS